MPRRKPRSKPVPGASQSANVLQTNRLANLKIETNPTRDAAIKTTNLENIEPLLGDENTRPDASGSNTASLYDELDSFRQRWKRELEETNKAELKSIETRDEPSQVGSPEKGSNENDSKVNEQSDMSGGSTYAKAKALFLKAVELEQSEKHYESIRYYKLAMHLYPNIERQIFKEQCEASVEADATKSGSFPVASDTCKDCSDDEPMIPLYDRIRQCLSDASSGTFTSCKPSSKHKPDTIHLSNLPHELIMQIYCYVIGHELDLASLESLGLVCRGFFLLSRDPLLWRSICLHTWGKDRIENVRRMESQHHREVEASEGQEHAIDWRQIFLDRPRVNFDGVYISRTKYIRQGDTGFQDITYRPFHVVTYFRYIRFFPDKKVLILTTNEEPEKICPIFRHASHLSQFSPELSILEGTYEFDVRKRQVTIVAEKDLQKDLPASTRNQRRQSQFHWPRQTPLSQKFNLRFKLGTDPDKPHKNNILKWRDYVILSRLESNYDLTTFDLSPETFPNLVFQRVKMFNLRLTKPLTYC